MIAYVDTSILIRLLVDDEPGRSDAERVWMEAEHLICAEIGYVEARAALASARRRGRISADGLRAAVTGLESLWEQIGRVAVNTALVRAAGDLAEEDRLRGYDAVHLGAAIIAQADVMASADHELVDAARRRGLAVMGSPG